MEQNSKYSLEKEDVASGAPGLNCWRQAVSAWIIEFFPWFFEKHFSHSNQFFWILGRLYKYYRSVHYWFWIAVPFHRSGRNLYFPLRKSAEEDCFSVIDWHKAYSKEPWKTLPSSQPIILWMGKLRPLNGDTRLTFTLMWALNFHIVF